MLHPSYTDLMKVVNQDVEEGYKDCQQPLFYCTCNSKESKTDHRRRDAACPCKRRREAAFYRN